MDLRQRTFCLTLEDVQNMTDDDDILFVDGDIGNIVRLESPGEGWTLEPISDEPGYDMYTHPNDARTAFETIVYIEGDLHSWTLGADDYELSDGSFKMYPNPASDRVFLRIGDQQSGKIAISIYDALGRLVMKRPMSDYSMKLEMNVSSLNPGLYLVKVKNDLGSENTKKLIIK